MEQFDFRRMSVYQIWVRSFCDGNGDGIGDTGCANHGSAQDIFRFYTAGYGCGRQQTDGLDDRWDMYRAPAGGSHCHPAYQGP